MANIILFSCTYCCSRNSVVWLQERKGSINIATEVWKSFYSQINNIADVPAYSECRLPLSKKIPLQWTEGIWGTAVDFLYLDTFILLKTKHLEIPPNKPLTRLVVSTTSYWVQKMEPCFADFRANGHKNMCCREISTQKNERAAPDSAELLGWRLRTHQPASCVRQQVLKRGCNLLYLGRFDWQFFHPVFLHR